MVGLFQPAVKYRRLRLSFVFSDLGCGLRGDRQSDSSADIQGAFFYPVTLGIVIAVILAAVLFADLYVTASGILKLNKRLDAMEKIAAELREVSDKVGENIYESVMDTLEFQEEKKKMLAAASSEFKEKLELRLNFGKGLEQPPKSRRLV